jgi:uncharacterized membrane protein YcaP (DUF421 family)
METVVRVSIIYLFLLVGLRIMGKREFSQLSPLELVTLLLIPELVAQALIRDDYSLTNAIVAVTTLFGLVFLTSLILHLSKTVEKVISGVPTVLVANGELLESNLNKERVSPDEIFSEMHKVGLYELRQVRWAILETDGHIALIPVESSSESHPSPTSHDRVT